ncbi:MAG: hypothetical protein KatS3mg103_0723 [Phycisphaerales bacterium]|nr:MAG: hypothetical protein KatS3mg103_0723 [Phycisphaerales bacterium]
MRSASERGVFVNFDMEHEALKDLTIELFMRCCEEVDFHAGLAMQAYLKSGVQDAQRLCQWAQRTGRVVTVRLVKGAYWDSETIHAEQEGWPCPVWNAKWQTDACFEAMSKVFLDACPRAGKVAGLGPTRLEPGRGGVKLALGSHNVRSIAAALAALDERGLPREAIELQMLHGMADQLKHAAAEMGLRVREYVPVGEMIPGMAYLVRRLLENTSNESWLKAGFLDQADPAVLLAQPGLTGKAESPPDLYTVAAERHRLSRRHPKVGNGQAFTNEPLRDFSKRPVREAFAQAIASASVPLVANDRTPEQGQAMVRAALAAFPAWRDADPIERAGVLTDAAAAMRARRDELSGIIIKENGKDWRNADADVAEAIDFCEYYARQSVHLFERERLGRFIGELDEVWYQPRGVAVVISPLELPPGHTPPGWPPPRWSPGNTVVLQARRADAGASPTVLVRRAAGGQRRPPPGRAVPTCCSSVRHPGETTGRRPPGAPPARWPSSPSPAPRPSGLVDRGRGRRGPPRRRAAPRQAGRRPRWGARTPSSSTPSADLDEAVLGVRQSAFGFQGQKCSACSRCIVVDPQGPDGPHSRTFIDRLVASTRSLVIGDPLRPGTDVGPVIDPQAAEGIKRHIQTALSEGLKLELAMEVPQGLAQAVGKPYVGPHVFSGVEPHHTLAREEVFGPVLAVMHASSYEQALHIANDHPYKLTGGVYTRKPSHIAKAKALFRVGNLYINRPITGALVARQPFGGFGLSGVGSKAGGADYLLQFVEPRASCENTMRRGFAPEL